MNTIKPGMVVQRRCGTIFKVISANKGIVLEEKTNPNIRRVRGAKISGRNFTDSTLYTIIESKSDNFKSLYDKLREG